MKLEFIETIGHQVFRVDDVSDEAPMAQIQFFNEFAELPYEIRAQAARAGLEKSLAILAGLEDAEPPAGEKK